MNIAEAAKHAALTPKAIRFYEAQRLLRPERSPNGYRAFNESDVRTLRFLKRARALGFSVDECRGFLALYQSPNLSGEEVKASAELRIADIDRRLDQLGWIRRALVELAQHPEPDQRPDAPAFEEGEGASSQANGLDQGGRRSA